MEHRCHMYEMKRWASCETAWCHWCVGKKERNGSEWMHRVFFGWGRHGAMLMDAVTSRCAGVATVYGLMYLAGRARGYAAPYLEAM